MTQEELQLFGDAQKHERGLIGAIFLENRLMHFALEHLNAKSFLTSEHRQVFAAMIELYKKDQEINANSVVGELMEHGWSEPANDISYVRSLEENVPTTLTIEKADYVERFIFVATAMAISSAALEESAVVDDVLKLADEKLRYAKRLMRATKEARVLTENLDAPVN